MEGTWRARVFALVVALLVTGPALAPGFVLLRDMVFVPRQDLDLDALGLGGSLPRAVPVDAVMGLLTAVVPGELLQKVVLVGIVWLAVLGAARLVPPGPTAAGVWPPGSPGWSTAGAPTSPSDCSWATGRLLLAYAALPWIARAGLRVRAAFAGRPAPPRPGLRARRSVAHRRDPGRRGRAGHGRPAAHAGGAGRARRSSPCPGCSPVPCIPRAGVSDPAGCPRSPPAARTGAVR